MTWILYILLFVFGYVTCHTFYFLKATRLSLSLVKGASVIYISSMIKALENLSYSREIMLEHMILAEKGSFEISSFEARFDDEVTHLKDKSIQVLLAQHPEFFRKMVEFEDWDSSVKYAEQYREEILKFWEISK